MSRYSNSNYFIGNNTYMYAMHDPSIYKILCNFNSEVTILLYYIIV